MIWPFSTLSDLRTRELDYNRQIASLTARLELVTQLHRSTEDRLATLYSQYIDDLRLIANLNRPDSIDDSQPDNSDSMVMTPSMRSVVDRMKADLQSHKGSLDMLGGAGSPFARRYSELNTHSELNLSVNSTHNVHPADHASDFSTDLDSED